MDLELRKVIREAIQPTRTHGEAIDAIAAALAPLIEARYVHREQRAFDRGYDNAMEGIEERVREAQAEAWADGFAAATDAVPEDVWFGSWSRTRNPYRDEESNA